MRGLGRRLAALMALLCAGLGLATAATAHQSGISYLSIREMPDDTQVQIDFSIQDLNAILQRPAAAEVTIDGLAAIESELARTVQQLLAVQVDGVPLPLAFASQNVVLHNDGLYLRQAYTAPPLEATAREVFVRYDFFSRGDSVARAYARLSLQGVEHSSVFDAQQPAQRFALGAFARTDAMARFAREGALHIWGGADHLLFLVCLLLPGLTRVRPAASSRWQAVRPAMVHALWVVTAFTVAHSITLAAAAMEWVRLPGRWTESIIALSIIIAALLNLTRRGHGRHGWLAFGFGLIHGLGFADGLRELGLTHGHFIETLLAFNLGVEFGQLAVLVAIGALLLPWMRRDWVRLRLAVWGSALVLPISGLWLTERLLTG